jgi:hypothetical protein
MKYEPISIEEAKKKIPFFSYFVVRDEFGTAIFEFDKTKTPEVDPIDFFSKKLDEVIKSDVFAALIIKAADKRGDTSNRPAYLIKIKEEATDQENFVFPFNLGKGKDLSSANNLFEMMQIMSANMDLKIQKSTHKLEVQREKDLAEMERKHAKEMMDLEKKMYEEQKKRDQEELQKLRDELEAQKEELEEKKNNVLGGMVGDVAKTVGVGAMEGLGNLIMKNFGFGALGSGATPTTTTTTTTKEDTPIEIEELDFSKTNNKKEDKEEEEEEGDELTEDEELVLEAFHSLPEDQKREMLRQMQEAAKQASKDE